MAHKLADPDNYTRIFIIGARNCSADDVTDTFSEFGHITDVYFPVDKATREKKGIVYVSFSKASEAALAVEKMNGKSAFNSRIIKVVMASSKKEGSVRDPNEESKMMRLFIVVPSNYSERDIENEFQKYGSVVSVQMVKDRKTSVGNGLAFVKFSRPYEAALALENCDPKFKPVFAENPKPRGDYRPEPRSDLRGEHRSDRRGPFDTSYGNGNMESNSLRMAEYGQLSRAPINRVPPMNNIGLTETALATLELLRHYSTLGQNQTVLEASFPTFVTYEHVSRLLDLVPGLEFCKYDQSSGRALFKYSTPQAAAYALDKLDTLEYPIGYQIRVRYAQDVSAGSTYGNQPVENVHNLVDSIQKATALLQQAGIAVGGSAMAVSNSGTSGGYGQGYPRVDRTKGDRQSFDCSISLPERRSILPRETPIVERLFIVSTPDTFEDKALEDIFCRFGNLIGAYFMPGKKFGYIKYASRESARQAMDALHGQTVFGNRLKVIPAEPMRRRENDSSKRDHSADDFAALNGNDDDMLEPRGKHSRFD